MIAWAVLLLAVVLLGVVLYMSSSSSSSQAGGMVKPSLGRALVGANVGGTPSGVAEGFSSSSTTAIA